MSSSNTGSTSASYAARAEARGSSPQSKPTHSPSTSLQGGRTSRSDSSSYSHCSFCLVAEFDIDKGSTLSYQYPAPVGYDEYLLAELMLPDGVHARSEDWTVFFLPASQSEGGTPSQTHSSPQQSSGSTGTRNGNGKGKERSRDDLFYVLNLVRTKHDNSVRRGALVKAIAVGSRHPFIHVFKPALLLALDDYFNSQSIDVLFRLFESLNSLDLTAMPQFSRDEKLILRASETRDLFEEYFKDIPQTRAPSGLRHLTNMNDDDDKTRGSTRSRSTSTSTTQSSIAEDVSRGANSNSMGTGGSRHHLPHRPSLASLRPGSSSNGLLKRRPSAAAQLQLNQAGGLDGSQISLPNSNPWRRPSGATGSPAAMLGNGKIKDTHYWETSVTYGRIQDLPIRIPTDVFAEEVGEYSLIDLVNTFSSSTPIGPHHAHLHSNGQLTPPVILLFNAIITGKRIVFLGHNQPANRVASMVLAACALGSGCGSAWRGIARRCFPYANLGTIDELEKVPGYIAGVTNPRFEDLHCWDVLLNIENGKIILAKDLGSAQIVRTNTRPTMTEAHSNNSLSASAGPGSEGENKLSRTPTEIDVFGGPTLSGVSVSGTVRGRDRGGALTEAKTDATEIVFIEDVLLAISARYGEKFVRARFADWAVNFLRLVARHEEHFYGHTNIAPASQPFLNGQLGSGVVSLDREAETKEVQANASRIEAFRESEAYTLLCKDIAQRERNRAIQGFDLSHQLTRLRRAKKLQTGECELIFVTIAKAVRTPEQIIELLAQLPPQQGGLSPLGCGLFHSNTTVRTAAQELCVRLTMHSVGKKFVQNLNLYYRLALARQLHEMHEAQQQPASSAASTTVTSSSSTIPSAAVTTSNTITSSGREGLPLGAAYQSSSLQPMDGLPATDTTAASHPFLSRSVSPGYSS